MEFLRAYQPRLLSVLPTGKSATQHIRHDGAFARLFHYSKEKFAEPVNDHTYWSDVDLRHPILVNPVTGVPNGICRWRAEWRFPIADAQKLVIVCEPRTYQAHGSHDLIDQVFVEYKNWRLVQQTELTWSPLTA